MTTLVVTDTTRFVRDVNSAAILAKLRKESPTSVSALASATGLSRQAVTRSLHKLEVDGVIEFAAPDRAAARSGRPAQLVRFRTEAGYVLGMYVNPQRVHIALADLAGTVISSHDGTLRASPVMTALITGIEAVLSTAGVSREKVWFASVGSPGIIDPAAGVIKLLPSMPELVGDVLARTLQEYLSCPVYVDNDIKLATQGERWSNPEMNGESLVFIHWGDRVGAGIVLNGRLHRGASNDAGDIGFLDLFADTPTQADAKTISSRAGLGRFEEWIGAAEIVALAVEEARSAGDTNLREAVQETTTDPIETVIDAALAGNDAANRAIDEVARRFAVGVVAIRAILDPESIVIAGPMARLGDDLLVLVRHHLADQPLNQPRLQTSSLGDDATVRGAIQHSLSAFEATSPLYRSPNQRSDA